MPDGMGSINKAGQPIGWSNARPESPKQSKEVANRNAFGTRETKKSGQKRKGDTFLKKEAKPRKLECLTTSLSERSAQNTAVRSNMKIDNDKYDINQICEDYRSKILSVKIFVEVKGLKSELKDIMEVHQELLTYNQIESLSTLIQNQERLSLQLDIIDADDIDKLPRLKSQIESLKYNSPKKDFSELDIAIGKNSLRQSC